MTQRQVTTFIAAGGVPDCRNCLKPPKHWFDARGVHVGGGHFFECSCGAGTSRHPTPELANRDWCQRNGVSQRTGELVPVGHISKRSRG